MINSKFANLALGVTALCAVTVTVLLVRREFLAPEIGNGKVPELFVANWRELGESGHVMGSNAAAVTILEFADFQCPYCAQLHKSIVALRNDTTLSFRLIYRHFPLPNHPQAQGAALASECASEAGKFTEYHDALFEHQNLVATGDWIGVAKIARLDDLTRFKQCIDDERYASKIERDRETGSKLNISGTPTVIINGHRFTGAPPTSELEKRIRSARQ